MFTSKGNKINKNVNLKGTAQLMIEGKAVFHSGVTVRADMGPVHMGSYVILKEEVIVRPSFNRKSGKVKYE